MSINHLKRLMWLVVASVLGCAAVAAQTGTCTTAGENNAWLGIQTIRLWPGDAPEAKGKACQDIPTLSVFEPPYGNSNGSAVLVFPGGSYTHLASIHEGREIADWFTAHGFRAFVLQYRLGSNGYLLPVPLIDARRAVQLVRARALDYHTDPTRIGVIGFSAGGHLAALASVQPVPGRPDADDPVERVSSKPDFLILGYPWIGAISADFSHLSYCKEFNLKDQCEALRAAYSPDLFVTKDTPPTFIFHTTEDQTVPVEQAVRFYAAMVKAGASAEMHIFAHGAHGLGLGRGDAALDMWPQLLDAWLRGRGLMQQPVPH